MGYEDLDARSPGTNTLRGVYGPGTRSLVACAVLDPHESSRPASGERHTTPAGSGARVDVFYDTLPGTYNYES